MNYDKLPEGVFYPNGGLMGVLLYTWDIWSLSPKLLTAQNDAGLVPKGYDYVSVDTTGSTSDVYLFYQNGPTGKLLGRVTLSYTDSGKGTLSSILRS